MHLEFPQMTFQSKSGNPAHLSNYLKNCDINASRQRAVTVRLICKTDRSK